MPKLAIPLTEKQVIELAPKSVPYKIGDGHGLYLFVETTGKKRWRMNYKRLGKGATLSLGTYPEVSLSAARQRCDNAHQLLAKGIDPIELKREYGKQEREARSTLPKTPKLRFSMNDDGGMVIEKPSSRLSMTATQVTALRSFLIATDDETQRE